MKKSKLKSLVKAARATAKKDIQTSIVTGLRETISQFGESSKKLNRDIEKAAKNLAKKISKDIKIYKTATADAQTEVLPQEPVVLAAPDPAVTKKPAAKAVKEDA